MVFIIAGQGGTGESFPAFDIGGAGVSRAAQRAATRAWRIPQSRKIRPNPFGAGSIGRARGDRRSAFLLRSGASQDADRGKRHDAKVKVEQPSQTAPPSPCRA